MSDRYPGGLIRKTPPTITPPVDGEGGSASGIWTMDQVAYYIKEGTWPQKVFSRELYAWGSNTYGQLGLDDSAITRSSPVQIGSDTNWKVLQASSSDALAIKTDGTLWAWGRNFYGQAGLNHTVQTSSPTQVGALTNWSKLATSAGSVTSTFAIKTDGTLWACGINSSGQLGQNDVIQRSSPVQIGSDTDWYAVAGTGSGNVFLKTDGTMWACGLNSNGHLAQNDTINRSSPVQVGADTDWQSIVGSAFHAIKTDGTLWAWGQNSSGQHGTNSTINTSSPVQVGVLTDWSKLGPVNNNLFAIKTDGTLWACGKNAQGCLGVGDKINYSSPVQIGADTDCYSTASN